MCIWHEYVMHEDMFYHGIGCLAQWWGMYLAYMSPVFNPQHPNSTPQLSRQHALSRNIFNFLYEVCGSIAFILWLRK